MVAKVEWHPGELYPRVGFIVTNLSRPAERVVASTTSAGRASNGSSKARERSSGRGCHAARSPPTLRPAAGHALTYNLANFVRTLALPEAIKQMSLTSLREELVERSAPRSCAMAATLHLQGRASQCRRNCSTRIRVLRSSRNYGHSRHQRLREKPDGHVFKGDRWEECVQMPGKMARSDPRPPSGLPVVAAVVRAANPPWQNTGYS